MSADQVHNEVTSCRSIIRDHNSYLVVKYHVARTSGYMPLVRAQHIVVF